MDAHTLMEEWEVSPFDGGYDGLCDLRARGFSGGVEVGGTVLFVRDGDPLAVVEDLRADPRRGDVDAFEGAVGDLHTAQRPGTATLAAMLALDGDVRGRYFTEDTSLATVHETLSEGGFTGYVELSENVLSGDYYVVYRDGREEYVAFVGSSTRILVEDEAQARAEGEVGIYSVVGVSLPDLELPQPTASGGRAAGDRAAGGTVEEAETDRAATGGTGSGSAATDLATADGTADGGTAGSGDSTAGSEYADGSAGEGPGAVADDRSADRRGRAANRDEAGESGGEPVVETDSGDQPSVSGPEPSGTTPDSGNTTDDAADDDTPDPALGAEADPPEEPTNGSGGDASSDSRTGSGSHHVDAPGGTDSGQGGSVIDAVTAKTVPSLDPRNSRQRRGDADGGSSSLPVGAGSGRERESAPEPRSDPVEESPPSSGSRRASDPEPDGQDGLEAVREEYEARIEDLRAELEELRTERDDQRRRIESLESGDVDPTADDGRTLSPGEAIAGTSLFVREGTRGGATLEDARDGETDRETLAGNVRVEYHTQFDDAGATVEGRPFEEWLRSTAHYGFVRWAIVDLLFEIRSTGSASSMRPLYDALPEVDRIGLRDSVAVGDGEGRREIAFDVVARNQMGDPLFVATIDESREPTAGEAMEPLVTDASDVCEYNETLAGTFAVTSSYFEPAALDTVREATSGSLLGRERYRSYVKLARKNGFHVCMVERRDDDFHLTVPEL